MVCFVPSVCLSIRKSCQRRDCSELGSVRNWVYHCITHIHIKCLMEGWLAKPHPVGSSDLLNVVLKTLANRSTSYVSKTGRQRASVAEIYASLIFRYTVLRFVSDSIHRLVTIYGKPGNAHWLCRLIVNFRSKQLFIDLCAS